MERPLKGALVNWLVVPEPTDCVGVLLWFVIEGSVPHSNHAVVANPLGVTFPFRVPPAAPTDVADKVETTGGFPGEDVVKLTIRPLVVPLLFSAQ